MVIVIVEFMEPVQILNARYNVGEMTGLPLDIARQLIAKDLARLVEEIPEELAEEDDE
jgi:hypothetical protein